MQDFNGWGQRPERGCRRGSRPRVGRAILALEPLEVRQLLADASLLPGTFMNISTNEASPVSGPLATFTDTDSLAKPTDFGVTINWGDGTSSAGSVTQPGGAGSAFTVSPAPAPATQHAFDESPTGAPYTVKVTVTDLIGRNDGGGQQTTITGTAAVAPATLSIVSNLSGTLPVTVGLPFTGTLASFTNAIANEGAGDYTATIDWGDGTVQPVVPSVSSTGGSIAGSHTYSAVGNELIKVSVTDGPTTVSTTLHANVANVAIAPAAVAPVEGVAVGGTVATFTSPATSATPADFTATINWGDGTSSAASITQPGGKGTVFDVAAQPGQGHVYADETGSGTPLTITVAVTPGSGPAATGTITPVVVKDAPLTAGPNTIRPVAGQTFSGAVTTFTDANPTATAADFMATINWGDGTSSAGTVTQTGTVLGGTTFSVSGSHPYAALPARGPSVTISDDGGNIATSGQDSPLTPGVGLRLSAVEGSPFTGTVATFSDADPQAQAADFTASINWGDGTSSAGKITQAGAAGTPFTVTPATSPQHVYTAPTSASGFPYNVAVTILDTAGRSDTGGQTTVVNDTATVTDAPLTATPAATVNVTEGTPFRALVATFNDAFSGAPTSSFTAAINWGDGTSSAGTVAFDPALKVYDVTGAHTYANELNAGITVNVNDTGGAAANPVITQAVVADAPLSLASHINVTPVAGQAFTTALATFVDANQNAPAGDFTASINWGDGTSSVGTVAATGAPGSAFAVVGSHTYAFTSATLSATLTIADKGGSKLTVPFTAQVLATASSLTGALSPASDSGVSNSDGITNVIQPVYHGTAVPGTVVQLLAIPLANPSIVVPVGATTVNAQGAWTLATNPLNDGRYAIVANDLDPKNNNALVQSALLSGSATQPPLVIATAGPSVGSVALSPKAGRLQVVLDDALAALNPAGLRNANNFQLGFATKKNGVQNIAPTDGGLSIAPGPAGGNEVVVNVKYPLGKHPRHGTYVVTLVANGLKDVAGNSLVERTLVTYPQTTNAPNNNYVAAINVNAKLGASAPHRYIPSIGKKTHKH